MKTAQFRKLVWNYYTEHGRHDLPWRPPTLKLRKSKQDEFAYQILVSEIMLQQTQVERVIPYYHAWIKKYSTGRALARTPLSEVLKSWQGLGYNRRAKALHAAAKELALLKSFPRTKAELVKLPGIGDYTAGAILAFAYDEPAIFIETNIRTAILHHFFNDTSENVSDPEIREVLKKVSPKDTPREWGYALMDYGAYLKRSGIRINSKAKGYTKQSSFAGSDREVRGALVRRLAQSHASAPALSGLFPKKRAAQVKAQLAKLLAEGLVEKSGRVYSLPG